MDIFQAIIIAIVEGITEFLPVSSTGHMIITERILGMEFTPFIKLYTVAIQLGAILSVIVLYYKKFLNLKSFNFYLKLVIAVIPSLVAGYLLADKIDELLESPLVVAITLFLGGIVLLFIDKVFKNPEVTEETAITPKKGFMIGCWQCLALIPGMSRSAASIIGGMQQKLTRSLAAEFSFFLAVPTMFAATAYKLLKGYKLLGAEEIKLLALGNLIAFVVAMLAIKFFIGYLQKHGFRMFGWYRIIVGAVILILLLTGSL